MLTSLPTTFNGGQTACLDVHNCVPALGLGARGFNGTEEGTTPYTQPKKPSAEEAPGNGAEGGSVPRRITFPAFVCDARQSFRTGQCFTPSLLPPHRHRSIYFVSQQRLNPSYLYSIPIDLKQPSFKPSRTLSPATRLISPSLHKPMIKTNQRFVLQIINPTSGESPRLLLEFQLQESLQVSARLNLRQYSTEATCPAASLASSLGLQTLHFKEHTSKSCQHLMLLSVTSLKSASLPVNTRATCLSHAEYSPFITGTHRFYFSA